MTISTSGLCKDYGNHRVLSDVNLNIGEGKLTGFLGPNGAGKTTTLRILLGLLGASAGHATIFGMNCWTNGRRIRNEVGYLPGDVHLYSTLTGQATLNHFARVRGRDCRAEIKRLADCFELPLRQRVRKYSTGMRQKLGLIQALMHRPKLLILDEPTSALDPLVRTRVFDELKTVVADGRSVLFSSHSLNEVEELCDEVVILRNGEIVEHQQIEVLRGRALRKVTIEFKTEMPTTFPPMFQILNQADNSVGELGAECRNNTVVGTWSGDVESLLGWVQSHAISDVYIEKPDLNDLFMTYYAGTQ